MKRNAFILRTVALLLAVLCLSGCGAKEWPWPELFHPVLPTYSVDIQEDQQEGIPEYTGQPYWVINGNQPQFTPEDLTRNAFERYSELDHLGRCGEVYANIGPELMPTEERGSIREIRPSGWHSVRYAFVDGESLYNRCHLIAFQLTGENANARNLITGTRYLNVEGMLPFENKVQDYIQGTGNHVLYRVTPVFEGDNLVAHGVQIEAFSVEDEGKGICFNVYVYNVQPGVIIDYSTGDSKVDEAAFAGGEVRDYVVNTNSKRFHFPDCDGVSTIKPEHRRDYTGTRGALLLQGYKSCGSCNP